MPVCSGISWGWTRSGSSRGLTQKVERLDRLLTATAEGPGRGGYAVPAGLWHSDRSPGRLAADG